MTVRRRVDGYLKLVYPNGEFTKEELEEIIQIALEMRHLVKEQLKKMDGGKLIPDGMCNPGQVYTVPNQLSAYLFKSEVV